MAITTYSGLTTPNPILCIYHANCLDGFGAAWAVYKAFKPEYLEFFEGKYGEPIPSKELVEGRDVVLVDFSYKAHELMQLALYARSVLVLDHHEGAQKELECFPVAADCWAQHITKLSTNNSYTPQVLFDMERSGAGITWDFFHPTKPRPPIINHIEDRDLWKFDLPYTKEINSAIASYEFSMNAWDIIVSMPIDSLIIEGTGIERKKQKDIATLLSLCSRREKIAGYNVPIANIPHIYASEAGHALSDGEPFAATYYDTDQGRTFSLRSSKEGGLNVQEIAKQFGGGGHKHASGFSVPATHPLAHI